MGISSDFKPNKQRFVTEDYLHFKNGTVSSVMTKRETDARQTDILLLLKTAVTVICIMLTMSSYSFLLKLADKFNQEHIDAVFVEVNSCMWRNQYVPFTPWLSEELKHLTNTQAFSS